MIGRPRRGRSGRLRARSWRQLNNAFNQQSISATRRMARQPCKRSSPVRGYGAMECFEDCIDVRRIRSLSRELVRRATSLSGEAAIEQSTTVAHPSIDTPKPCKCPRVSDEMSSLNCEASKNAMLPFGRSIVRARKLEHLMRLDALLGSLAQNADQINPTTMVPSSTVIPTSLRAQIARDRGANAENTSSLTDTIVDQLGRTAKRFPFSSVARELLATDTRQPARRGRPILKGSPSPYYPIRSATAFGHKRRKVHFAPEVTSFPPTDSWSADRSQGPVGKKR